MPSVKTAISLRKQLFERADALAREMKIPRSRLFALALEELLERHDTQELVERINAAYEDGLDTEETALLRGMRPHFRRIVKDEW